MGRTIMRLYYLKEEKYNTGIFIKYNFQQIILLLDDIVLPH